MTRHLLSAALAASLLLAAAGSVPVRADNAMNYQLLSERDAAGLPRNHGALGLNVERSQVINDSGMTFEIMRVTQVRRESSGAQAGFRPGDQIIAVDGHVFPSLATFAAYVGSRTPGDRVMIDYMPAGGGPAQAQRVPVTVGESGGAARSMPAAGSNGGAPSAGLSTGTKVAIGVGAAALFGCYELGCFNHRKPAPAAQPSPQ